MIVQQVDNAERADNTESNNKTIINNAVNSTSTLIIIPQLTHWKVNKISLFNSHLNKSHEEDEIVTVKKNVYYQNVMLFIEWI